MTAGSFGQTDPNLTNLSQGIEAYYKSLSPQEKIEADMRLKAAEKLITNLLEGKSQPGDVEKIVDYYKTDPAARMMMRAHGDMMRHMFATEGLSSLLPQQLAIAQDLSKLDDESLMRIQIGVVEMQGLGAKKDKTPEEMARYRQLRDFPLSIAFDNPHREALEAVANGGRAQFDNGGIRPGFEALQPLLTKIVEMVASTLSQSMDSMGLKLQDRNLLFLQNGVRPPENENVITSTFVGTALRREQDGIATPVAILRNPNGPNGEKGQLYMLDSNQLQDRIHNLGQRAEKGDIVAWSERRELEHAETMLNHSMLTGGFDNRSPITNADQFKPEVSQQTTPTAPRLETSLGLRPFG